MVMRRAWRRGSHRQRDSLGLYRGSTQYQMTSTARRTLQTALDRLQCPVELGRAGAWMSEARGSGPIFLFIPI